MHRIVSTYFIALGCIITPLFAEFIVPSLPSNTPVYDEVGLLSPEEKTRLENTIITLEKETNHQIGIAIIKSLQKRTIEEVWIIMARSWWIGQKWLDNGLLFLVAPTEREMRIEVGRGLEWVITDLMTKRIVDENLTPHFREERYGTGLEEALARMTPLLRGEIVTLPEKKNGSPSESMQFLFILLVTFGWWLLSILSASKSWWLGGLFGVIIGLIVASLSGAVLIGIFGLILDYFLSTFAYGKIWVLRNLGNNRWGGWGGSSWGGWGGFGGGWFWGGGASGKW